MTKRIFEIEWHDDLGPFWMNEDNLFICIDAYCDVEGIRVKDITEEVEETRAELLAVD